MNVPIFFFRRGLALQPSLASSFQPSCISLTNADVRGVFCQVQLNMILKQVRDNTGQFGRGESEREHWGSESSLQEYSCLIRDFWLSALN